MLLKSKVVYAFCIIVFANVDWSHSEMENDMYLATTHYEILLDMHESIMIALEKFVEDEVKRLADFKRHLYRYKMEHYWAMFDDDYIENPLNAFTVIKRLTTDLDQIKKLIQYQIDSAMYLDDIIKADEEKLPGENDLYGAALAVRRIQAMYKLDVRKLSEGIIDHNDVVTHSLPMSGNDCYEMSRILYENEDFRGAKAWVERAIWKEKQVQNQEEYTFYKTYLDDVNERLEVNNLIDQTMAEYAVWDQETWDKEGALCRNEMEVPHNISKKLTCYLSRSNPYLQLAPVKTEQLYIDPEIFIYHDVISDAEIEHLKGLSEPELVRAEDEEDTSKKIRTASYRTCKHMWVTDETSEVAARISQRVSDFTGLGVEMAEDLQIVNYGIGGHYHGHHDFDRKNEDSTISTGLQGNRIATVLFYMSDVAQGGATVFIELGLSVFPIKNAALVWTNLLPSGEGDLATLHAACPVLMGTKWTATKWLHQAGQELIRPCNLEYQREEDVRPIPKPILRVRSD